MTALEEAEQLGCESLQIFTHSPRLWRGARISQEDADRFHKERLRLDLHPLVVHTPYLPNLCTADEALYKMSYHALLTDLETCERIRTDFLVIHPGSYSESSTPADGLERLTTALNRALQTEGKTVILIENMAGGGRRMGDRFEQVAEMIRGIENKSRIGLCLDTAHTLGSGYPFSNADEVRQTLDDVDRLIGLSNLKVIHANDSRAERGTHRDLHEHIGQGHIGRDAFRALLADPRLAEVAVILETPKEPPGSDALNLGELRKLTT
jgi:deoxyribonuclease-4